MYVENINMEHGKNMYPKINCDEQLKVMSTQATARGNF